MGSLREITFALARELDVVGLINIQCAIKDGEIYILEVNPRASRTVPFVSKVTGIPLAKIAAKVMVGKSLEEMGFTREKEISHVAVKEAVFPFVRFPGADIILGPEMRSTGEVMGISDNFGAAFAKAQMAAGFSLPSKGTVFVSVADRHKPAVVRIAARLKELGFRLVATRRTSEFLRKNGIEVVAAKKIAEGRPNIEDHIKNGDIDLIINTPVGRGPKFDEYRIRRQAVVHQVPVITTIPGALAAVGAIEGLKRGALAVRSLQEYHRDARRI